MFAYLDDIVVVIQPGQAEAAHNLVRNVLNAHGLTLNEGKTVVWCRDTGQVLPATLARLRKDDLRMLGSDVRFLDRREDREEFGSPVHGSVNGQAVLQAAQGLTRRLRELQAAGLTSKSAYAVLHTYAQSCCTHLQRANYEQGHWLEALDGELRLGLGEIGSGDLTAAQRTLASLRLKEGGLAFGGLQDRSAGAFLASWATCLEHGAGQMDTGSL